jgi:parvulin-like peptidyl-prolyl isomerase
MRAEAEKIRKEAIAGEDFNKLEIEACTAAGDPDVAPDPVVGKVTRDTARQFQQLIFDELQPGQISELVTYQDSWLLFKVVSKQIMPLDEAKKFTVPLMQEASDTLRTSVEPEFNETYFVKDRTQAVKHSAKHAN